MNRLDHVMDKLEEYVCFITLAIMSIAVLMQVVNRAFLARPFPYGEELARYMMVWATMFGTSAGVKIGAHVGVDALIQIVPANIRVLVTLITGLMALAFFAVVGYLATEIVVSIRETEQISPALQMPMWIAYLALPLGFALCLFRQCQLVVKKIKEFREAGKGDGGAA